MHGHDSGGSVHAHAAVAARMDPHRPVARERREEIERLTLSSGATLAAGAGDRARPEEPDPWRTCFERDRDRIIHSTAFRRLAGKTQVVVFPSDHQRTRLTHALEVAQVARAIADGVGANETLTEAMALGHDCGHGPGGHASEDAFDPFLPQGYHHGAWGADVVLTGLNLCAETLDGIRNHSWSCPAPATVEGEIVSWADRIAYCAHDLEDAIRAGILATADIPAEIAEAIGVTRSHQIGAFIHAVVETTCATGAVGMDATTAETLARLRAFNYERIYMRDESRAQARGVIALLRALVEYYAEHPAAVPRPDQDDPVRAAVTYVAGMTDRYAIARGRDLLGFDTAAIPRWV